MIITSTSLIIIVLTILLLGIIVYGWSKHNLDVLFPGFMFLFLVGALGWGLCFGTSQAIAVKRPVEANIVVAKDKAIYFVNEKGIPYVTVTDVAVYTTYENVTNKVTINQLGYVNYYGITNWSTQYEYIY